MLFTVLHGLSGQSVEEVTASIVLLEEKIWKKSMQASPDVILHRIKTYSDGLWRVKMDDDYAGYLFCIRLDERDILENHSWVRSQIMGKYPNTPIMEIVFLEFPLVRQFHLLAVSSWNIGQEYLMRMFIVDVKEFIFVAAFHHCRH